ncbi:MAG: DUF1178 family protein [Pseudomonadota bacterium]
MIRYALHCLDCDAAFDAWFASSDAYDRQAEAGQVTCPACDSARTAKQIMAPAIGKSGEKSARAKLKAFAAKARQHVAENYDYVGGAFADEARAMHYGEAKERPIWGETKPEEAKALADEGVPAAPLPKPFAPTPPKPDKAIN